MIVKITVVSVVLIAVGLACLRRHMAGVRYNNTTTRLDGKTVLITGANTGIGKETAMDLAKRGARVILACRDLDKAKTAADDIKNRTGNANIIIKRLDLASLKSIKLFAGDINANENRLDILINNAGIMRCPYWKTENGFEMQFGVNHLGHFLLTNLLLDLIKKSAPSRILTVSSLAHERGTINFDDIYSEKSYDPGTSYSQSKLANVLFSRELSKRLEGTGVTTYSLHPGLIDTELKRHWEKESIILRIFFSIGQYIVKTPEEGAQTTIYCAVDEKLTSESGKYYSDCAEKTPSKEALDDEISNKLWTLSAQMVGLNTGST
ncbi:retinol dehydrogenase 13-like [Mytilus galloprovincialis]|uniref:retinol dehydrogenase 13-like n=1 Tax=Mytilus trossulus TaxID=6551 RepID=UPI003007E9DC